MLTEQERIAIELTAKLYEALRNLPAQHSHDMGEYVRDIHDIQNRIMSRPVARALSFES